MSNYGRRVILPFTGMPLKFANIAEDVRNGAGVGAWIMRAFRSRIVTDSVVHRDDHNARGRPIVGTSGRRSWLAS
jgi:hypothetical protein